MTPFNDASQLHALLDVEVALAVAEAEVGVIPAFCVTDIRAAARPDTFDLAALQVEARRAGNIVIPLVRQLTDAVTAINPASARYVHHGATSQDIIDTALVLQLRASIPAISHSLTRAIESLGELARVHRATVMPGRTWLQQASPTTFGLKAAGWLDMIGRSRERLTDALDRMLVVQLGGASGSLASLGNAGPAVIDAFARCLSLGVPDIPWHGHRDRVATVATALGIVCGALGKVGRDLVLLAQSEVGEVFETPAAGRGGSSSMPHKRNPVRAVTAVTAAIRSPGLVSTMLAAMPQEHERAAGGWQAEWTTLPELVTLTGESADAIAAAVGDLTVDASRMRHNLTIGGGVAMTEALATALRAHLPRNETMTLVERLSRDAERDGRTLADVAAEDAVVRTYLSPDEIRRLLTPDNYLGAASIFIERVLHRWSV